jgi:predicted nucleic acid-binding protein
MAQNKDFKQLNIRQIVIDAGPLIAYLDARDNRHTECSRGFDQLIEARTRLLCPMPIVFEVYRKLLQKTYPREAQEALVFMNRSLHLIEIDKEGFDYIQGFILELAEWKGTLEDASVVVTALKYDCHVWTLDYRDFSYFKNLRLWNPLLD